MAALYNPKNNDVVVLTQKDFVSTEGANRIKANKLEHPGVIQVYARWCPHCQDKAPFIRQLAVKMRDSGIERSIYVLESDESNQTICGLMGVQYLPSFYKVDKTGKIGRKRLEVAEARDIIGHLGGS